MKGKIRGIRMGKTVGESGHCRETECLQSRKESVACRRIVEVGLQAKGNSQQASQAKRHAARVFSCMYALSHGWSRGVILSQLCIPIDTPIKKISKKKKMETPVYSRSSQFPGSSLLLVPNH